MSELADPDHYRPEEKALLAAIKQAHRLAAHAATLTQQFHHLVVQLQHDHTLHGIGEVAAQYHQTLVTLQAHTERAIQNWQTALGVMTEQTGRNPVIQYGDSYIQLETLTKEDQ